MVDEAPDPNTINAPLTVPPVVAQVKTSPALKAFEPLPADAHTQVLRVPE
jgi:hypothetical protein